MADRTQEDVTVMDVQHGCRVVGPLMHNSGQLGHPLALNVDPYTGLLLVLCLPGSPESQELRLVVCGSTCARVESKLAATLGKLW